MSRVIVTIGIALVVSVQADIYLNKAEGDSCEHEGVQGICRRAEMCPSFSIQARYHRRGCWPRQCPTEPEKTICSWINLHKVVCCTDCYIDDASKAVVTLDGVIWKTGVVRKSYDKCAEYAADLPYPWKDGKDITFKKVYDTEKKCHNLEVVVKKEKVKGKQQPHGVRVDFPYIALVGQVFGDPSRLLLDCQASVISNRFLITSAYCVSFFESNPASVYAVMGIDEYPQSSSTLLLNKWQRHKVKQVFSHPDYTHPLSYYDIGLIETVTEIQFGINVLPMCLYDLPSIPETVEVDVLGREGGVNNTKVSIQKKDEEECSAIIDALSLDEKSLNVPRGIDFDMQTCYIECNGRCRRSVGRLIFTRGGLQGMSYAVGIISFRTSCSASAVNTSTTDIYTRINTFLPWIESIVWP